MKVLREKCKPHFSTKTFYTFSPIKIICIDVPEKITVISSLTGQNRMSISIPSNLIRRILSSAGMYVNYIYEHFPAKSIVQGLIGCYYHYFNH
jgi:hypothetical protein